MNEFDFFAMQVQEAKTSAEAPYHLLIGKLPASEFALSVKMSSGQIQTWPMHDPAACSQAIDRFRQEADLLPASVKASTAARLLTRAQEFGLPVAGLDAVAGSPDPVQWSDVESRHVASYQKRIKKSSTPEVEYPVVSEWSLESTTPRGQKVSFAVRKRSDVDAALSFFDRQFPKLSSTDRRRMAQGILQVFERVGVDPRDETASNKLSESLKRYGGTHLRDEAATHLRMRAHDVEIGSGIAATITAREKAAHVYRVLADQIKSASADQLEVIANHVDRLDQALTLRPAIPAHEAVFYAIGEKYSEGEFDDDPVYTYAETSIRASDLAELPKVPLARLEAVLGSEVTDNLRSDPVGTFRGLDAAQRKIVAHFVEDVIKNNKLHRRGNLLF